MRSLLNLRQRHVAMLGVLVSGIAAVSLATAQDAGGRKLGTCGAPPRKNPQRQTSAEGMPPLPLPATPLRRSEPKAEPAPPVMIAKLEYGTTQDWNTDPGDCDNLMRHCRYELGLWYGWKHLNANELVTAHKAGVQSKIPILYVSGHEAFEFTEDQRAALRQYVLDGGTLLGDACCGRAEFATSFRREALRLFPDRSFDVLQVDHPIFRAFYPYSNVHYVCYDGAVKNEDQGPAQLVGMNIGCRTAVILSPFDLSCGWDEHTHPHGARLIPGDAIRLGINIVSYVAAERKLGEAQSITREVVAPASRGRQQFQMAQLRHQGDWNPDPNSTQQLLRHIALDSSLSVNFGLKTVDATESQLAAHPFLFFTGHRDPKFTDDEVKAIRRHLDAGGFLFVNNCCGRSEFDQHVRSLVKRIYPDQSLAKLDRAHPLFKSFFPIEDLRDRQTCGAREADLEGISVKERLVIVYSKHDMITALKQVADPYGDGFDAASCRQLAVNVVAYAIQN